MLATLSAAELNRPFQASNMQSVEEFFQILPHPNPEMKVAQRIDWLTRGDYRPTAGKIGQLEIRRDVFITKAILFLGRTIVSSNITVVESYYNRLWLAATNPDGRVVAIMNSIDFGKEIVNVS